MRFGAVLALLSLSGCHTPQRVRPELDVAAAANLMDVCEQMGPLFESEAGARLRFSFASTAQLTRQIESGAPFDIFAAADSDHVAELERKGFLTPGSRAVYARGVLALWIPASSKAIVQRVQDLTLPGVRVIAIAKPDLAPYGQAAVDTLEKLGIWAQVKPKVVYGENITEATQYGKSGNADAVFTAYSLVLHESGTVLKVEENLHKPILQELGIVAKSPRQSEARRFVRFLLEGHGESILAKFGYQAP